MKFIKDFVICVPVVFIFLLAVFALDDSYENADLSAQVLDEAIAQAYADYQEQKEHSYLLNNMVAKNGNEK